MHYSTVRREAYQSMKLHLVLLTFSALSRAAAQGSGPDLYETEDDASLKARLLSAYGSISTRPGLAARKLGLLPAVACTAPTPADVVETQVWVEKWHPLQMNAQTFGFDGYLRAWWQDVRLAYNGSAQGGCRDKLVFGDTDRASIWKPEFYWEGLEAVALPHKAGMGRGESLEVYPDGSIWWSRQVSFTLSCPVATTLGKLPFDTQTCTYQMGMYAETEADVQLRWRDGKTGLDNYDGTCLAEWFVTGFAQRDSVSVYVSANFTYATAEISFSRSPDVLMMSYFLPSVLLVLCSYCGFFIDPMATPARVTLGMLTLVVSGNSFLGLNAQLPTVLLPPWLARVVYSCIIFNFVGFMGVVLVSFGSLSSRWLDEQYRMLKQQMSWHHHLVHHASKLTQLFHEWDDDGNVRDRRSCSRSSRPLLAPAPRPHADIPPSPCPCPGHAVILKPIRARLPDVFDDRREASRRPNSAEEWPH